MEPLKQPLVIEASGEADPGLAAPVDVVPVPPRLVRRRSVLGRLAAWVFGLLFGLVLAVSGWNFVTGLLVSFPALGWLAAGLVAVAGGLLLAWLAGEARSWARLARVEAIRAEALAVGDLASARAVLLRLGGLYGGRVELAEARARLDRRGAEVFDADALVSLAEVELLAPLDALARAEVEAAARQVALVTALVPLALADVATALVANVRMIRRVAEIYGGRAGTLGSWRLMRRVMGALMAAGALALTDDLIGSVAGGGILSKVSRRFGEGVVNGALTVRVGLAAMELCRPLPFVAVAKPGVGATVSRALAGLFG